MMIARMALLAGVRPLHEHRLSSVEVRNVEVTSQLKKEEKNTAKTRTAATATAV